MKPRLWLTWIVWLAAAAPLAAESVSIAPILLPFSEAPMSLGQQLRDGIMSGNALYAALDEHTAGFLAYYLHELDFSQQADRRVLGGLVRGVPADEIRQALASQDPHSAVVKQVASRLAAAQREAEREVVPIARKEVSQALEGLANGSLSAAQFMATAGELRKLNVYGPSVSLLTRDAAEAAYRLRRQGADDKIRRWAGQAKEKVIALDADRSGEQAILNGGASLTLNAKQRKDLILLLARAQLQPRDSQTSQQLRAAMKDVREGRDVSAVFKPQTAAGIEKVDLSPMAVAPKSGTPLPEGEPLDGIKTARVVADALSAAFPRRSYTVIQNMQEIGVSDDTLGKVVFSLPADRPLGPGTKIAAFFLIPDMDMTEQAVFLQQVLADHGVIVRHGRETVFFLDAQALPPQEALRLIAN